MESLFSSPLSLLTNLSPAAPSDTLWLRKMRMPITLSLHIFGGDRHGLPSQEGETGAELGVNCAVLYSKSLSFFGFKFRVFMELG